MRIPYLGAHRLKTGDIQISQYPYDPEFYLEIKREYFKATKTKESEKNLVESRKWSQRSPIFLLISLLIGGRQ